jgi:hypothetical protein
VEFSDGFRGGCLEKARDEVSLRQVEDGFGVSSQLNLRLISCLVGEGVIYRLFGLEGEMGPLVREMKLFGVTWFLEKNDDGSHKVKLRSCSAARSVSYLGELAKCTVRFHLVFRPTHCCSCRTSTGTIYILGHVRLFRFGLDQV